MKKFLSILLVFAMVLSLSTPAFAVDAPTNIGTTEDGDNTASRNVTATYTPTPEAKWGASKDTLDADDANSGSGTLAEALEKAKTNPEIKYIQLQKTPTVPTSGYYIYGGAFTLDLNGQTVSCADNVFTLNSDNAHPNGATVTFTDTSTAKTGKVEASGVQSSAIEIRRGNVTIAGGSFVSTYAILYMSEGSTLKLTGGKFTGEYIQYMGGTLDLSKYPTAEIADLRFYNGKGSGVTVGTDILPPKGYGIYNVDQASDEFVTDLTGGIYAVAKIPIEAKWGASKEALGTDDCGSGTLAEALEKAKTNSDIKYIQLQKTPSVPENGYFICGGTFTLDLNGFTVSNGDYVFTLSSNGDDPSGATVTFTDTSTAKTGKVESSEVGSSAIQVQKGKAVIAGGSYEANYRALDVLGGSITVTGGSIKTTGNSYDTVSIAQGSMTIEGGSFTANNGAVVTMTEDGALTIKGGAFQAGSVIYYNSGTIDLSAYSTTTTSTTTPITNLIVEQRSDEEVTVGVEIKLPSGYSFCEKDDAEKTIVSKLEANGKYAIIPTSEGTVYVPEAKWGASANDLTMGEGTLEEALEKAKENANIKYIQLQKTPSVPETGYGIYGGTFTLDLNGYAVSCDGNNVFTINSDDVTVTFADTSTAKTGKVEATQDGHWAIMLSKGNVTIAGGSFVSKNVIVYMSEGSTLTLTGGKFTGNYIYYYGGTLDLSKYPTAEIGDLRFYNANGDGVTVGTDILIPKGYGCYCADDADMDFVTDLTWGIYAVAKTPIEAKWGKSATDLTMGEGTLKQALKAAEENPEIKYIQLQKTPSVPTYGYSIYGGAFTLDLNGFTVSNDTYVFTLHSNNDQPDGMTVTFTDTSTAGTGKVECTTDGASAIILQKGTLIIKNGSYRSGYYAVSLEGGNATIEGGSFEKSGGAILVFGASLTIAGGSFTDNKYVIVVADDANVTVKGGAFQAGSVINYSDNSGTLDLSAYPTTASDTTTPITNLIVGKWSLMELTVGVKIKLPNGYSFCEKDDAEKTIVSCLKPGVTYAIIPTSEGTFEAKWGESVDKLTGSGTLAQALAEAKTNSTIKYIQLQNNPNVPTNGYKIEGGTFTLDLNGQSVVSDDEVIFWIEGGNVTFTDSKTGGTVRSTHDYGYGFAVYGGKLTVSGGTYEGDCPLWLDKNAETVINGGTFKASYYGYSVLNNGTLTINDGTFTGGYGNLYTFSGSQTTVIGGTFVMDGDENIYYKGGKLDLSAFANKADLTKLDLYYNLSPDDATDADTITLPAGYVFSLDGLTKADPLKYRRSYSIIPESAISNEVQAQWGADAEHLTESGTLEQALEEAAKENSTVGYIQLLVDMPNTRGFDVEGGKFTLDLNGHTITSDSYYVLLPDSKDADVTILDSKTGGKLKCTTEDGAAVWVYEGNATIKSGIYEGDFAVYVYTSATIDGGTFIGTNEDDSTIACKGNLTINDGTFSGGFSSVCGTFSKGSIVVNGGTFTKGVYGNFVYWAGVLDLSNYNGTTPITDLVVHIDEDYDTISADTIDLPEFCYFYDLEDTSKTPVTELKGNCEYGIVKIVPEAKWGKSATDLNIGSGTLEEALEKAKENPEIKYIQLQKNPTVPEGGYYIYGGAFTLDLNGYTVSYDGYVFVIDSDDEHPNGATVTFTDTSTEGTGKVECTNEVCSALLVEDGTLTVTGGHYECAYDTLYVRGGSATIEGGSFVATGEGSDALFFNEDGISLTIKGGTFTADRSMLYMDAETSTVNIAGGNFAEGTTIIYGSGKLDFSKFSTTSTKPITNLIVENWTDQEVTVGNTVKLPTGYSFCEKDDAEKTIVSKLKAEGKYAIIPTSEGTFEAKWGASADDLTIGEGTLEEALEKAKENPEIKYIQLQKNLTAPEYGYDIQGGTFTLDLNGYTISTGMQISISSSQATADVTFTDTSTSKTGKIVGEDIYGNLIDVALAKVTFVDGTYENSQYVLNTSGADVTISGGNFVYTGEESGCIALIESHIDGDDADDDGSTTASTTASSLTITGGSFSADQIAYVSQDCTMTITGGNFSKANTIILDGATLDLSKYPTTQTVPNLYVNNAAETDVTVGTDLKIPAGYYVYNADGGQEGAISKIEWGQTGGIKKITIEAKWGASATDLSIGEGSLAQALQEASTNSNIKYIQLQKDLDILGYFLLDGGTFTLDLNGHTVTTCTNEAFYFSEESMADVTVIDSKTGGTVKSTDTYGSAFEVDAGKLTIEGGTYEAYDPLRVSNGGGTETKHATAVINGGTFKATDEGCAVSNSGELTINGGTFSGGDSNLCIGRASTKTTVNGGTFGMCSVANIEYRGGVLDLYEYQGKTSITELKLIFTGGELKEIEGRILLPDGYGLYDVEDENKTPVDVIGSGPTYGIVDIKATITGVSVKVGDKTYTTGNISLTPTSGNVTITVTGTNLDKSDAAWVKYVGDAGKKLSSGWTIDANGTTATITIPATDFASCTSAYQLTYSADGTNSVNSGIYIHYVAETTSVQIVWGAMNFTYSDEQDANGADKGWTCAENANTVTVKNTGTASVIVSVDYAKNTETAYITNVTGAFDISSKGLDAQEEATFTLTITGKPDGALNNATLGSATITIQKNEGQ